MGQRRCRLLGRAHPAQLAGGPQPRVSRLSINPSLRLLCGRSDDHDRGPWTERDLDAELWALCLEERPQLYALAGMDYAAGDGGLIGWILAWEHRVIIYWCGGHRSVSVFASLADFWSQHKAHGRDSDVRIVPMDGQPRPQLD